VQCSVAAFVTAVYDYTLLDKENVRNISKAVICCSFKQLGIQDACTNFLPFLCIWYTRVGFGLVSRFVPSYAFRRCSSQSLMHPKILAVVQRVVDCNEVI
jgi:hypothetical protein